MLKARLRRNGPEVWIIGDSEPGAPNAESGEEGGGTIEADSPELSLPHGAIVEEQPRRRAS